MRNIPTRELITRHNLGWIRLRRIACKAIEKKLRCGIMGGKGQKRFVSEIRKRIPKLMVLLSHGQPAAYIFDTVASFAVCNLTLLGKNCR